MAGKPGNKKGGRINYTSSDKEIFMDIIKNGDGGKVGQDIFKWKIFIFSLSALQHCNVWNYDKWYETQVRSCRA